jgi:hypothetical protein
MQKRAAAQAIRPIASGGRVARTQAAIAIDRIVGLIAERGIINAKLRVVEKIEHLNAKLHGRSLSYRPMLEKGEI